jgi:hypothetical protein
MSGDISNNGCVPTQLNNENNSHDMDWELQNKLREQWLKDNPDAKYLGWMSI